jgi:hypothetical protein
VLSCCHGHSRAPHDTIVVVEYVDEPLQLDACMGNEIRTITIFHTSCSGIATYATIVKAVMWHAAMTMISQVARHYNDILQWQPDFPIKPHQKSIGCLKSFFQILRAKALKKFQVPMAYHSKSFALC